MTTLEETFDKWGGAHMGTVQLKLAVLLNRQATCFHHFAYCVLQQVQGACFINVHHLIFDQVGQQDMDISPQSSAAVAWLVTFPCVLTVFSFAVMVKKALPVLLVLPVVALCLLVVVVMVKELCRLPGVDHAMWTWLNVGFGPV